MKRNYVVLVRGPCGSGKSTLCRTWAGRAPYGLRLLATDEVQARVDFPNLPDEREFNLVLDQLGLEISHRLSDSPLLVDAGLRDPEHIDRALRPSGRHRGDLEVVLIRLTVGVEEAVRRKRDLPEARVRELHEKWQTRPAEGETVLPTEGFAEREISRRFGKILAELLHTRSVRKSASG
jgi:hypothetical protein